jgi:hypothetical protein
MTNQAWEVAAAHKRSLLNRQIENTGYKAYASDQRDVSKIDVGLPAKQADMTEAPVETILDKIRSGTWTSYEVTVSWAST